MKDQQKSLASFIMLTVIFVIFIQINVITFMLFMLKGEIVKTSYNTNESQYIANKNKETKELNKWTLSIPKINIVGNIEDGTDEETINESIGHFETTSYISGNIGLVAGCYGYDKNYFQGLEKLEIGDIIIYQYGDENKQYEVSSNIIIDEKDWSYLEKTNENKLTLITGVINEPQKRRCVQAIAI